ncbi:unnamed protein product [Clonostachys rosea f. rosea IK726]|uniref:Uncharacterized protein n=1 Tax=Clonostachys rosea f. rosea IK726 TaxID=1349383 RepID=A0ACA9T773_BIOOC|nr:unnamed protein product [Clonostachys rosea f. rosea IK726]
MGIRAGNRHTCIRERDAIDGMRKPRPSLSEDSQYPERDLKRTGFPKKNERTDSKRQRQRQQNKTKQDETSAMCNWNTYTFDCGCMSMDLRSRCQRKLADDELDPCFWMQRVSDKWRFHQQRMCDACNYRLMHGEYVPMRKQARWSEIGARAHEIAWLMARARQLG